MKDVVGILCGTIIEFILLVDKKWVKEFDDMRNSKIEIFELALFGSRCAI